MFNVYQWNTSTSCVPSCAIHLQPDSLYNVYHYNAVQSLQNLPIHGKFVVSVTSFIHSCECRILYPKFACLVCTEFCRLRNSQAIPLSPLSLPGLYGSARDNRRSGYHGRALEARYRRELCMHTELPQALSASTRTELLGTFHINRIAALKLIRGRKH